MAAVQVSSAEYDNSMTYLGNDTDYKRWAKQAGAGDAIVISTWNGPGTVKLVLVDGNGKPANAKLVQDVYNYIVSPSDRSARLLPTGTAELTCTAATTVAVNYVLHFPIHRECFKVLDSCDCRNQRSYIVVP